MALEITKVELFGENRDGNPLSYTCASGTAIAKGTLLTITDPRTVTANSASGAQCAGIAAMDKSGSDFSTKIAVWTDGIFEGYASGAITAGDKIQAANLNYLGTAVTFQDVIGYALETAADGTLFTFRVNL
jgi:hypothetical protein